MKYTPDEIATEAALTSEMRDKSAKLAATDKLFDVTMVVGSVYAGGTMNPYQAAFNLIGSVQRDGEYSFPDGAEGMVYVSVQSESQVKMGE